MAFSCPEKKYNELQTICCNCNIIEMILRHIEIILRHKSVHGLSACKNSPKYNGGRSIEIQYQRRRTLFLIYIFDKFVRQCTQVVCLYAWMSRISTTF